MAGAERNRMLGGYEFNPYAAGAKIYGNMTQSPTSGPVDKSGYAERDRKLKARRNAILAKIQAGNTGAYASSNFQRFVK